MKYSYLTDPGKVRDHNEDSVVITENANKEILLAVADGMGGHLAGEVASSIAITHIGKRFREMSTVGNKEDAFNWLQEAFSEINALIYQYTESHPESKGMGTTLTCALIFKNKLIVLNCGDSRIYSLKNDQYLYFFVSLLSIETQKELIDAYLDDNLLVNIISYLKPESIKYLFKVDKRINYLFPRIYLKDLIENGTVFPNEILNNNKFFNMLKSNSLITFRKTINDLEKNNLPEPIEFYISKYYEELLNSYNEEYDMFNDYVYVINRLNKLNNNVNFNTYILDSDAEKVVTVEDVVEYIKENVK